MLFRSVEIHLNYIGQFAIPCEAESDTENDANSETDEKRAMWREYKRDQRAKAKQALSENDDAEHGTDTDTAEDEKRAMWREYKRNQRVKAKQSPQKQKSTRNPKSAKAI